MEKLFSRFPHLSDKVCNNLDDKSLACLKEVSPQWKSYLSSQKSFDVRIIVATVQRFDEFGDSWKKVLLKSSKKTILALRKSVQKFYHEKMYLFKNDNQNPLHVSAGAGNKLLFEILYEKAGDKYPKNNHGKTPIHFAAAFGHFEICEFIIENAKSKHPICILGSSPLRLAATNGHVKIVEYIIDMIRFFNVRKYYYQVNIMGTLAKYLAIHWNRTSI